MAEVRSAQTTVERLAQASATEAREGQIVVERLGQAAPTEVRLAQTVVEYLYEAVPPPPSPPGAHGRRGRSFEFDIPFSLPIDERLFDTPTKGTGAPADPDDDYNPPHGYDEALDECFCIIQKGGDRTAPMSWALAVVNIGDGSETLAPADRPSNYGLVWIWFDAPTWGSNSPSLMKYSLTSGQDPTSGANSKFSTQAFRAILIHKFIEPGKRYHVAVQLRIDSGSPGDQGTNTAWNHDGEFNVLVSEDGNPPTSYTAFDEPKGPTVDGMEVYKGPVDSIGYLIKYGVRYQARDAMFLGLGQRSIVWKKASFIPWGADAAPLKYGGYRMIDRSAHLVDDIYGAGIHTLRITKALLSDTYVTVNHRGLAASNTNGGTAPMGFWGGSAYLEWAGLNAAAAAGQPFNPEGLRNYRLVTTADFADGTPDAKGMVLNIHSYQEIAVGGPYQITLTAGNTIGPIASSPVLIQAFRWHQREILIGEVRFWSEPREYDDTNALLASRRKLSLGRTIRIDDQTEPDIENLIACWPLDDAGGAVLRELVAGRSGFLAPVGLGLADGGER